MHFLTTMLHYMDKVHSRIFVVHSGHVTKPLMSCNVPANMMKKQYCNNTNQSSQNSCYMQYFFTYLVHPFTRK